MNPLLTVNVEAVGLAGPGLPDWPSAAAILRGDMPFQAETMAKPVASSLSSRDRRRHTFTIALAVATALDAVELEQADELPAVFACSGGDTDVIDRIINAILQPGHPVSPQQFMNSVHNAPAGYWSIASGNRAAITSLSAFDASFAAGLLEAAVQIADGRRRVLLVAYDAPAPMPIWPFRPLTAPFASALLLTAADKDSKPMARLGLTLDGQGEETSMASAELEKLRLGNPAARSLPLLEALAGRQQAAISIPYLEPKKLALEVQPC